MEMKEFTIKMKDSYTVAELANIWHQITTTYKMTKQAYGKEQDEISKSLYNTSKSNMTVLRDYVTTKISTDDMVKLFDYLAGINKTTGKDKVGLLK